MVGCILITASAWILLSNPAMMIFGLSLICIGILIVIIGIILLVIPETPPDRP